MRTPKNWKCECGTTQPYQAGQRCTFCKRWRWPARSDLPYWWKALKTSPAEGISYNTARAMIEAVLIDLKMLPRPIQRPSERAMGRIDVLKTIRNSELHIMCRHCDHFVEYNTAHETNASLAEYVHLDDGEQEYDHDAEPGLTKSHREWVNCRPELFDYFTDNKCGPNSDMFPGRRGKVDAP